MNYWWVNHKQTFRHELEGEYIWSPQKKSNNAYNQSYTNLTLVAAGDIVVSYAGGLIKAIGVAEDRYTIDKIPPEFTGVKNTWSPNGYRVKIAWTLLKRPIKPKEYMPRIGPLLPPKLSPIRLNGNGNQGVYLAAIGNALGDLLMLLSEGDNPAITSVVDLTRANIADEIEEREINSSSMPELTKLQLIKARVGQGIFRQKLLQIESKCRITGLDNPRFLIASHMKPWRLADNIEKIDGNNGLLLSPHVDSLFDKALITFSKTGTMLFANRATEATAASWNFGKENLGELNPKQNKYMAFHRNLFQEQLTAELQ
jgi:putative restriction endonuclease